MEHEPNKKVKIVPQKITNGCVDGLVIARSYENGYVWEVVLGWASLFLGEGIKKIVSYRERGQTLVTGAMTLMWVLILFFAFVVAAQVYVATTEATAMKAALVRRTIEGGYTSGSVTTDVTAITCYRSDYSEREVACTTHIEINLYGIGFQIEREEKLP